MIPVVFGALPEYDTCDFSNSIWTPHLAFSELYLTSYLSFFKLHWKSNLQFFVLYSNIICIFFLAVEVGCENVFRRLVIQSDRLTPQLTSTIHPVVKVHLNYMFGLLHISKYIRRHDWLFVIFNLNVFVIRTWHLSSNIENIEINTILFFSPLVINWRHTLSRKNLLFKRCNGLNKKI
jgi:hypothetical protein